MSEFLWFMCAIFAVVGGGLLTYRVNLSDDQNARRDPDYKAAKFYAVIAVVILFAAFSGMSSCLIGVHAF